MPDGSVARVGKRALPAADAIGEFIGLTGSARAARRPSRDTLDRWRGASTAASTSRSSAPRATATRT